jgi:hypothetical protein
MKSVEHNMQPLHGCIILVEAFSTSHELALLSIQILRDLAYLLAAVNALFDRFLLADGLGRVVEVADTVTTMET